MGALLEILRNKKVEFSHSLTTGFNSLKEEGYVLH